MDDALVTRNDRGAVLKMATRSRCWTRIHCVSPFRKGGTFPAASFYFLEGVNCPSLAKIGPWHFPSQAQDKLKIKGPGQIFLAFTDYSGSPPLPEYKKTAVPSPAGQMGGAVRLFWPMGCEERGCASLPG